MNYSKLYNRRKTSQNRPIPGSNQVRNSAGGYAWAVDKWTLLDRFLILGSESGTYYVNAQALTRENAENVIAAIKEDGARVVAQIVDVSVNARAPKNDPAIFALALCASFGDDKTRALALQALPQVCRTGTHLFAFADAVNGLRGWGRGLRKAVGRWYTEKDAKTLEFQLLKYKQREGWSQADLLRLAHPVPKDEAQRALFKWAVDGDVGESMSMVKAAESLNGLKAGEAAAIVKEARLPREALPTELMNTAEVQEALLEEMPLTALLRNLGNLSKSGLLVAGSDAEARVLAALGNEDRLKKARIHPIAVLNALATYGKGKGFRGSGEWLPAVSVVEALDEAFYKSFANVEATGKRIALALDVSGSMAGSQVNGLAGVSCREAAGAMALVTTAAEKNVATLAFDTGVYPLALSKRQRLDDVVRLLTQTGGGGTDCSAPIRYATEKKIAVDAFVMYTDSETWYGQQHPAQAMVEYRKALGIGAKLVVVAMASNRFSVGDENDVLTLNVVGLDASVPEVVSQFLR